MTTNDVFPTVVPRTLGSAFSKLTDPDEIELAVMQMEYLAKGEWDAVAVTKLAQLDIDVPFKPPLFSDKVANEKYWPQVRQWAARQLGWEAKSKACPSCSKEEGFDYDKASKKVTCKACGKEKLT